MPSVAPFARSIRPLIAAAPLLVLAACGGGDRNAAQGGMAGQTPEVGYVVVQPTQAPVTTELAGRTQPYKTAEVRQQVTGLITQRNFTEGPHVRQGPPDLNSAA